MLRYHCCATIAAPPCCATIAAPAPRLPLKKAALWERHHGLWASLRKNPLTAGEHYAAGDGRSGARTDDCIVAGARAFARRFAYAGADVDPTSCGRPYEVARLDAEAWAHESARIEAQAEANDYSLEDPDVVK